MLKSAPVLLPIVHLTVRLKADFVIREIQFIEPWVVLVEVRGEVKASGGEVWLELIVGASRGLGMVKDPWLSCSSTLCLNASCACLISDLIIALSLLRFWSKHRTVFLQTWVAEVY